MWLDKGEPVSEVEEMDKRIAFLERKIKLKECEKKLGKLDETSDEEIEEESAAVT